MEAKLSEWRTRPPTAMCRCCLSENCYKDIVTEYYCMGIREVYADMLKETFDVMISYCSASGLSRLICETCIGRLREAAAFKKQVQECEAAIMRLLGGVDAEIKEEDISIEVGKMAEVPSIIPETSDFDNRDNEMPVADDEMPVSDDDNDDDLDDQPLTMLASRNSKKDSLDLQELIDIVKPAEKRKSSSRLKAIAEKKPKKENVKDKNKQKNKGEKQTVEKKKKGPRKDADELTERKVNKPKKRLFERSVSNNPQRQNAVLIIKYSTAMPFKTKFNRILCAYCHDELDNMALLREHVAANHLNADHNSAFYKVVDALKIDISNFKCVLCDTDMLNVDALMTHLSKEHEKKVNVDVPFGVLPYRQGPLGQWMCLECDKTFAEFSQINGHLRTHLKIFTCDKCTATFLSEHGLKQHERNFRCYNAEYKPRFGKALKHRSNTEIILQCSTACPFRTWGQNFNCILCRVQSNDPQGLRKHMANQHANFDVQLVFNRKLRKEFLKVDITDLQCKLCFGRIDSMDDLIAHLKNDHKQPINADVQPGVLPFRLNDGSTWECVLCPNRFADFISLKKHTSEHYQNYVCDTCGEGFVTQGALIAHIRIPHDNKYNCSRCVATFTTLDERNHHIKTQHTSLPYMCNYCKDKPRFASWELRKRHLMDLHNYKPGAAAYECTTCHMTFNTRSQKYHHNVKAHRTPRDQDCAYPCASCSRAFASKLALDKHTAKKHYHV